MKSIDKTSEAMEQFADGLVGLFIGTLKSMESRLNTIYDKRTGESSSESQPAVPEEPDSRDSEIRSPYTHDKPGDGSNP